MPINTWFGVTASASNARVVAELDLRNNDLNGKIPPELANLLDLKRLVLFGNRLSGQIPPVLENLSKLEGLFLSHNRLTGTIPEELGNFHGALLAKTCWQPAQW